MKNTNNKLEVVFGDVTCGVHGENFHYLFSYSTNGLESMVVDGKEWLYRTPKPTFWRATTDNDHGNRFHLKSGMWIAADQFIKWENTEVEIDGEPVLDYLPPDNNIFLSNVVATTFRITFTYGTVTVPSTQVVVSYRIDACGKIMVNVKYHGQENLPELPVFGMRFIMPTVAKKYCYQGLSGETYPDRKRGAIEGEYEVEGLPVTPYLTPQDCGMHMDTSWVEIYRDTVLDNRKRVCPMTKLRIEYIDEKFAFTCLPYTATELENATHQEELPPKRRTVLCVLGAVRGVGGINSWGADVEEAYHINAKDDIEYSFSIQGM